MEQIKDLRRDRTALGVLCFSFSMIISTFIDILCVGVYFGITLCLVYLTFLKDCLEIIIYATVKFITRMKWLYQIFKIKELLYVCSVTNEFDLTTLNVQDSINVHSDTCLVKNSPDHVASSSYTSKSTYNPSLFASSQSNSFQSKGEEETASPALFQSPISSKSGSESPVPRKLSSLSTHVISSTENFNIDETNFEDVDLSEEKTECNLKPLNEESKVRLNSSKWNIARMKFFENIRKNKLSSPDNVRTKLSNIAAKVLPHRVDDNKKLIHDKMDSPKQVGCCTLPHIFKSKYQMNSLTSYSHF